MTDESEPEFLGAPTVDQCAAVYGSMPEPTVRTFHAKLLAAGYDISLSGAQRFIAKHIKKSQPQRPPATTDAPLTPEEVDLIEQDMTELKALEVPQLKAMLDKERLVCNIMLLRFSQRKADLLAMIPKDTAALVKSMAEAQVSIPMVPADRTLIDVTPNEQNEVSNAIDMFLKREDVAN